MNNIFVNLHTHSEYSNTRLLDSINKLDDIILKTNNLGNPGVALTDHECLSGHIKFLKKIEELKNKGKIDKQFKGVLGNEIYLIDEKELNSRRNSGEKIEFYHFVLIALDEIGYNQLKRISSRAWLRAFNYKGLQRVPTYYSDIEYVIGEDKGHLVACSGCLGSWLDKAILKTIDDEEVFEEISVFLDWCINMFGREKFFLELQPSIIKFDEYGNEEFNEQKYVNKKLISCARVYGLKYVITTDAHYCDKQDAKIHEAFLQSKDGQGNREVASFYETTYLHSVEELYDEMNYLSKQEIDEGIKNTNEILKMVGDYGIFKPVKIPKTELPNEEQWFKFDETIIDKYDNIKYLYKQSGKYHRYLISEVMRGFFNKINKEDYDETLKRIDVESKEIIGISKNKNEEVGAYLTTMAKIVDIIWEISIIGVSRGSCAGFVINYLLGICQENPLKMPTYMPHFRFITAERPEFPDCDIDVCAHLKDRVFDKVKEYYQSIGGDVVRVATFGTESSKSAIKTVCRGLGINNDEASYLSSLIPVVRGNVRDIYSTYYGDEEKGLKPVKEFVKVVDEYSSKNLLNTLLKVEGLISSVGQHACFEGESLITTKRGLKKIKDVEIGDEVLTHKNRFMPVVNTMVNKSEDIYNLRLCSSFPFKVTGNHPMYVRKKTYKGFEPPVWKEVEKLNRKTDYIGIAINSESIVPSCEKLPKDKNEFWWIIGRYLGDGWTECHDRKRTNSVWEEKRIIICCNSKVNYELKDITEKLESLKFDYRYEKTKSIYKIHIKKQYLYEYLQSYGRYANGKHLNEEILNLPKSLLKSFLEGYMSADGHYYETTNRWSFKTVSKELAIGMMQVIHKVYNTPTAMTIIKPSQDIIEGRVVNSKEKYQVCYKTDCKHTKSFYEDGYIWTRIHTIEKTKEKQDMFNLTVDEDHSYVVHGAIVHNCGVLPTNTSFTENNSYMRTTTGDLISCWELHDSEEAGGMKFDLLVTNAMSMIQHTIIELVKDGFMEWKGSLRATYDFYLSPEKLEMEDDNMWSLLRENKILSIFQFESSIAQEALKVIKPKCLEELATGNSIMRLMRENGEQPMERYARYSSNANAWEEDMRKFGLNNEEVLLCKKLFGSENGVCSSQEILMLATMEVSGFSIKESNVIRKAIAKKKAKLLEESKQLFYEKGLQLGRRKVLLDYIWEEQFDMQKGYAFSSLHTTGYSLIGIQEMNLVYRFPSLYWSNSVLQAESGALDESKDKATNYGKISTAIDKIKKNGTNVKLPDINKSSLGFKVDVENNAILYGLKGINTINGENVKSIMDNRPYKSLKDFHERMVLTKVEKTSSTGKIQKKSIITDKQTIQLIKAGCFNEIENKNKIDILLDYLHMIFPDKTKLTATDINKALDLGLVFGFDEEVKMYNFKNFVSGLTKIQDENSKSVKWVNFGELGEDEEYVTDRFFEMFPTVTKLKYDNNGSLMITVTGSGKGSFPSECKKQIEPLIKYLNDKEFLGVYNNIKFNENIKEHMVKTEGDAEYEAVKFAESKTSLDFINDSFGAVDFNELSETPEVVGVTRLKQKVLVDGVEEIKIREFDKYKLNNVIGYVIDKNNAKHMVSLYTKYGVVNVKFNQGEYASYNSNISFIDENGDKITLEKSMFEKGNCVLVQGFRRGSQFVAKKYKNSTYSHCMVRVTNIDVETGLITVREDRLKKEDFI